MNKHVLIYIAIILLISSIIFIDLINKSKDLQPVRQEINLTNTDTIYQQIDSLEIISDTIKVYYEKKVFNYHILPRSERIKLFSDRINR
jgi:uncharacterized membrane protein